MITHTAITLLRPILGVLSKVMFLLLYIVILPTKAIYYLLKFLIKVGVTLIKLSIFVLGQLLNVLFVTSIKGLPFIGVCIFQFFLDIFVLFIKLLCKLIEYFIYILRLVLEKVTSFYKSLDFYRKLLNNIMFNTLLRKSIYNKLKLLFLKYKILFIIYAKNISPQKIISNPLKSFFIAIEKFTIRGERNLLTVLKQVMLFIFNSFKFVINIFLLILLILNSLYGVLLNFLKLKTYQKFFLVIYNAKLIIIKEIFLDIKLFIKFIIKIPNNIIIYLGHIFKIFSIYIYNLFFWCKKYYLKTSFLFIVFIVCVTTFGLLIKNNKLNLNSLNEADNTVSITNVVLSLVNFCTDIKCNLGVKHQKIVISAKNYKSLNQELLKNNINSEVADSIFKAIQSITNPTDLKLSGEAYVTLVTSNQKNALTKVSQLEIPINNSYNIIVEPAKNYSTFTAYKQKKKLIKYYVKQSFIINDNYYISANNSQIPSNVINTFSKILSWHIDFQRDINTGDRVEVLYQCTSDTNNMVTSNKLIYASIKLNHKHLVFYNYDGDFYLQSGRSATMALLRTPVEGYRISSPFGKRSHPILGYSIFHKGIDFAAPTGTPVPASGNGIVKRVSISPTFGNVIEIQHNAYLSTLYAHLNAFAKDMKVGKVVYQRDIIGYIGSTGRATGPHLHYEVHFNGKPVNPVDVKLPSSSYLSEEHLNDFNHYKEEIQQILLKIPLNQRVSISFDTV